MFAQEISLAVLNATVVDGTGRDPIKGLVVLVDEKGRIAWVGPRQEVALPETATVVDGSDMTLLPGLIDGHVHLAWDKWLYVPHAKGEQVAPLTDPMRLLVRAAHHAQMALVAGVTTLRDCGADDYSILALRDMVARGSFTGPRILACGRPITTTAGHVYSDWGVDSAEEMKKAARQIAAHDADLIKVIVSGGTTSPGTNIGRSQYGLEELRTVVEEGRRLGLPVAAHAISTDSIRLAAEVGVDTIEHCSWIGRDPKSVEPDLDAIERMAEAGVAVDHAIIPRPYLFPQEMGLDPNPEEEWWLKMLRVRWPVLHEMRRMGVTVFLGTDAGFGPWPGTDVWPRFQELARAMEIIVTHAGFSPLEAIAMVTGESAKALGIAHEVGTIEVGQRADLVLVKGNPARNIRCLRDVQRVYRHGQLVVANGRLVPASASSASSGRRGWELPDSA